MSGGQDKPNAGAGNAEGSASPPAAERGGARVRDALSSGLALPQTNVAFDRPRVVGILNLTPDSFSDGSSYGDEDAAVEAGLRMAGEGADIIDVGAESTRPGAGRIDSGEQTRRLGQVIPRLRRRLDEAGFRQVVISVDTTRGQVAQRAFDDGAQIVNDVSAGRDDPPMAGLVARYRAGWVLMHMQGQPDTMQLNPRYENVVEQVRAFLLQRAGAAEAQGVDPGQIMIDPGIGFGKTAEHNRLLLGGLHRFVDTGYPVLLGTSRKRFLREMVSPGDGAADPRSDGSLWAALDQATAATTAMGVAAGVAVVRVHNVAINRVAAAVGWSLRKTTG